MKLEARQLAGFLRNPGPVRAVLLYGEDEGTIRHRAEQLTRAVVGQRDDPFRVAWLSSREEHGKLAEEASAIAMLGGRRVVRVREAGDALTDMVRQAASGPGDSLIVLEAGSLPKGSKLRGLVEGLPDGAAIACYPEEGRALRDAIEGGLREGGVRLAPDALAWLLQRVGSDREATRGEVDKLLLYAGPERTLDLDAVRACVGDQAAVSFDDALFAATAGDVAGADRSLERALGEGMAPVAVARGLLTHLSRLHQARAQADAGASPAEAVRALRPPVFFKRLDQFSQALVHWPRPRLEAALQEARRVELACKQTGAPDALLVRRLVLSLARQAMPSRAGRVSPGSAA